MPSGHQFDHMIAAVDRDGKRTYVDLTADIVPYGSLPPQEQGEFGLVVHPDGTSEEITFPSDPSASNKTEIHLVGALTPDGLFAGKWTRLASGAQQYAMRGSMSKSTKPDSTERARATLALANAIFDGSAGDSLQLFDGRDLAAEPKHLGADQAREGGVGRRRHGDPHDPAAQLRRAQRHLGARSARRAEVSDRRREGVGAAHGDRGAEADAARGVEGEAAAERHGVERVRDVRRGVLAGWATSCASRAGSRARKAMQPATKYDELMAWMKKMSADDAKYVILEH